MKNYSLRPSSALDSELIYSIKKNALGEYIKLTWGWDEEVQRKMHEKEMLAENISIIIFDNKEIGTIGKILNENEIIICRLYIIDEYQSYGIGSDIVNSIIVDNPVKEIRLGVLKVNMRARKLFEKLGFVVYEEENEHFRMIYEKNK
ncbi:MAG: GNAT family N-acetyltransferase [Ignavibacteria bacterium]